MHGVTGRKGTNQHLVRSIREIRRQGGVALGDGTQVMPDPGLACRRMRQVLAARGIAQRTTRLQPTNITLS